MIYAYSPALQEDETLYSWCSTVHMMSGNRSSEETSSQLFGMNHCARQHDLPAQIPKLLQSQLQEVTTEEAIINHTVAGLYFPFLESTNKYHGWALQTGDDFRWKIHPGHLRRLLLCQSRTLPYKLPLKLCRVCLKLDIDLIGRSYWHVEHQWPTSRYCRIHGTLLHVMGFPQKKWVLPPQNDVMRSEVQSGNIEATQIDQLINRIAHAVANTHPINTAALRSSARRRLQQLGVIHSSYAVRHQRLVEWYMEHPIRKWCLSDKNGLHTLAEPEWLPKLFWRQNQDHPIRWIIAWAALAWESDSAAVSALIASQSGITPDIDGQLPLFSQTQSSNSRPLASDIPTSVRDCISTASSYHEAMAILGVPRGHLTRWLEADKDLRASWRMRMKNNALAKAESTIKSLVTTHPCITRNKLRIIAAQEISLLHKYRHTQLIETLSSIPSREERQLRLL